MAGILTKVFHSSNAHLSLRFTWEFQKIRLAEVGKDGNSSKVY